VLKRMALDGDHGSQEVVTARHTHTGPHYLDLEDSISTGEHGVPHSNYSDASCTTIAVLAALTTRRIDIQCGEPVLAESANLGPRGRGWDHEGNEPESLSSAVTVTWAMTFGSE